MMKMRNSKWSGAGVTMTAAMVVACLSASAAFAQGDTGATPARAALVVETVVVDRGAVTEVVFADGNARAAKREFLMFESDGRVAFLKSNDDGGPLREGDAVASGELLAELDRRVDDASTRAVRAELDTARATLANARDELERAKRLSATRAIAVTQFNAVETAYEQALAAVRAAEARSDQARAGLRQLQIRAPFDGVVAFVNIREGDYVSPAQFDRTSDRTAVRTSPIVVIDPASFEVLVELPVVSGRKIRPGQTAFILDEGTLAHVQEYGIDSLDGVEGLDDLLIAGRVASVSPAVDPGSRSIRARVVTGDVVDSLSDGGYVTVWIETNRRDDVVTAPMESLVYRGDVASAFVVDPETGLVEQRTVSPGLTGDGGVEIVSGLEAGDVVVTKGRYRLTSGMRVRPVAVTEEPQ